MKKSKLKVVHQKDELKSSQLEEEASVMYEVLKELPKPEGAMKLNASQKKWWYWFGYEFINTNQFTKVDLMHLQEAAFWMDARCKAIGEINKKGYAGLVQTFDKGSTNITGHVSVVEKADKHLDNVSAHFGLSIKDRKKLGAVSEGSGNQLSLFEQFAQAING